MALEWWRTPGKRRVVVKVLPAEPCELAPPQVYVVTHPGGRQTAHSTLHHAQGHILVEHPKAHWLTRATATSWDCLDDESGERITVRKLMVRGMGWTTD
jgi:hypothetical protein